MAESEDAAIQTVEYAVEMANNPEILKAIEKMFQQQLAEKAVEVIDAFGDDDCSDNEE